MRPGSSSINGTTMKNTIFAFVIAIFLMHKLAAQENTNAAAENSTAAKDNEFFLLSEKWKDAYNSKDAKNLIPFYSEDAEYISAHVPGYIASGRSEVIANFQRGIDGGGSISSIEVLSTSFSCDMAVVVTRYKALNAGQKADGRNLLVWKKTNGKWVIIKHMTAVKD